MSKSAAKAASKSAHLLPAVDLYIAKSAPFAQPILEHLRDAIHQGAPGVEEAIKWSHPFFVHKGVILANMAAFKQHCSLGLWGADLTNELKAEGVTSGGSMGSFGRITSMKDLPPRKKLVEYVQRAAKLIDDGTRIKAWTRPKAKVAKPETELPGLFAAALKKNKAAAKAWEAAAPGCRREYVNWIVEAKRDETRDKRIFTTLEWIVAGKTRNWKYES
jgi:uncharacterized protein YdeI (YjbR/CyaY-like superfamily)